MTNHPVFQQLRRELKVPYRVLFTTVDELTAWLQVRGLDPVDKDRWDQPDTMEWIARQARAGKRDLLKISAELFDDNGRLTVYTPEAWDESYVQLGEIDQEQDQPSFDDVPF